MEARTGSKPLTFAPRRSKMADRLNLPYMDGVMLVASVGLVAVSVLTLAIAARHEVPGEPLYFAARQGLYAVIGIGLMIAVSRLDPVRLRDLRVSIYTAMVASIVLVLVAGAAVRGSQRWIELPLFRLQPSELAKVLLCVSLAAFAFERARRPWKLRRTFGLLCLGLAPACLVFLQPDLGSGIVLLVVTLGILFVAGVPWQHFAAIAAATIAIGGGALAAGSVAGVDLLRGYQEDRLTAFLHPSDDPGDASYQVNQSQIAIGSGEGTGRGSDATQTELLFVPERHTDFIFAAIGERFGFLGAALLICLYGVLFWRILLIVSRSPHFFGTLTAAGILVMLGFQATVNLGMNVGVMPVTGVPLPLISYGGSSVVGTFLALGLLQGIVARSRR